MNRHPPRYRTACRPLAAAVHVALCATLISPLYLAASVAHAQTEQRVISFNIPSGPLGSTLTRVAEQSGVLLTFDPALVEGQSAAAVTGEMTAQQALQRALQGSGLEIVAGSNGSYRLQRVDSVTLAPVKVNAGGVSDGTAEQGYRSEKVSQVGPWQGRPLQETPYAISVVPAELIENLQASTADQVFKLNPVTQMYWPQIQNDNPYVFMRGFQTTTFARDGIRRQQWNYAHGTTMEEVERMEILTGLSGFLYGAGNVGGIVNFVTKRPTNERLNSITLTNTGGNNYLLHGDFGGRFDESGRFGYRINAVAQDGETHVDNLAIERSFISGAFDWHVTEDLLVQFDASKRDYRLDGRQAYWYVAPGADRPVAARIDSDKSWGQKWAMQDIESERWGASVRWNINEKVSLRGGYLDESNIRAGTSADNTIQSDGSYTQEIWTNRDAPQEIEGTGAYAFADFVFDTGSISHKLTAGVQYSDSIWHMYPDSNTQVIEYAGLSLSEPDYRSRPMFPEHGTQPIYSNYDQRTRSITIGDDITFSDRWSALIGLNDARVYNRNYDESGVRTSRYDESELTPSLSIIYKPAATWMTYVSYMEGFEQGGIASETYSGLPVVNANQVMSPLVSEQIEVGVKKELGGLLLTAALFEIDKPLEYYEVLNGTQARLVQDGRQVHRGLEFTATGKLTQNFTLVGGMSLLDAEVRKNEQSPALEGNRPPAVADRMFKLFGEYSLPGVRGLTVNGGISYNGDFYGDNLNTDRLPSYTLLDLGARYVLDARGFPLTLRVTANNITDKRFWANQYFLGEARNIIVSANLKF